MLRPLLFIVLLCVGGIVHAAPCNGPADIEHAIANSPSANAYGALGAWFAQRHQLACAIPAFEKALQLDPNSWETHFNLGLALMETKQYSRAASEFQSVLKRKPDFLPARNALGGALQAGNRLEAAEAAFRAVLQADAHSVYALDHLAQIYSAERRYKLAVDHWKRAVALAPGDADLKIALAVACV